MDGSVPPHEPWLPGILHLENFARALRLWWPWHEWLAPDRPGVGTGNPCDEEDMDVFHAPTKVTVGDGNKVSFWELAWLNGVLGPRRLYH